MTTETLPGQLDLPLGPTEDEIAAMNAEYAVLVPKILTSCQNIHPRVVLAALMSAAGSVACATIDTKEEAGKYLTMCLHDVLVQFPAIYAGREAANGNNAGEQSQSSH